MSNTVNVILNLLTLIFFFYLIVRGLRGMIDDICKLIGKGKKKNVRYIRVDSSDGSGADEQAE